MTAFHGDRLKISSLWNNLRDHLGHLSSDLGQAMKVLGLEFKSVLPKMLWDFPYHFFREAGVLLALTQTISRDGCRHTHTKQG